jgi:pimeloyl-ACP methyl ester carboxylesterase
MRHLILLPGLACDATLWRDQLPVLAARAAATESSTWTSTQARVSVTDVHTRHDTMADMAAAVLAEHPGELVLVGASMGGIVALEAALAAPQRVRGLALLGSTARPDTPEVAQLRLDAIEFFEQGRADEVLHANAPFMFHPDLPEDHEIVATYLEFVRRAGTAALVRQNRAIAARGDLRPRLAEIRCPTLVLCGEADAITPPDASQELAAGIAGARLHLVPGSGHLLTLEQPARVNALLLDWLADLG